MKIATSFSKQVVPPRKKCKSSVVWEQRKRELVCALSLSRSSFLSLSLSVFIQGKRKEHQQVSPYVYEGNQDTFNPSSVFSFFFSAFLRFFFFRFLSSVSFEPDYKSARNRIFWNYQCFAQWFVCFRGCSDQPCNTEWSCSGLSYSEEILDMKVLLMNDIEDYGDVVNENI